MAIRRWRDAIGDDAYDAADWRNADDCDYCGAPVMFQDPQWDGEVMAPGENQCPSCGATNLAPIEPTTNTTNKERKMSTIGDKAEQEVQKQSPLGRVNAVARVLIAAVGLANVHAGAAEDTGTETGALVEAIHGLDHDGVRVLLGLARTILGIAGDVDAVEDDDATD